MTGSGGVVRLLTSRSQHVSWSPLESSEVSKGTIVPFNSSSFSAIERLPLPLFARMKNIKKIKIKYKTFHCLPIFFLLFAGKRLIAKLIRGNF